jgi:hypothetical protein
MQKIINTLSLVTIFLAWVLVILVTYWIVYPYKPVVFTTESFPVDEKVVKAGGYLTYNASYCKFNNLVPQTTKAFSDGVLYILPTEVALSKEMGCGNIKVQTYVPTSLPASKYRLKISYRYQVNPIKAITITAQTEEFTVIK